MSRTRYLDFATHHKLPLDVAADTNLVLGIKGSGKTFLGMKLAESMIRAGVPVVAIDITGVWWGLSISADGKAAGLDLIVFGGPHADVPLEPAAGELIARFVVESGRSAVLDLSLMRIGEQQRFCADFLETLYRLKATHRENLHLMMDEANRLAPQRPGPDQARVLGASEMIVLQGRSRGLGMTMLTQRPAILNNNLRTQAGAIFALRISSPHDQKAVREWLDIHATPEHAAEIEATLAKQENGQCWYFSTSGGRPVQMKVAPRETFDSSRTPRPGERVRKISAKREVDLSKLTAEIKATAEAAEASKPATLKKLLAERDRKIVDLEGKLRTEDLVVRAPVVKIPAARISKLTAALTRSADLIAKVGSDRLEAANKLEAARAQIAAEIPKLIEAMSAARTLAAEIAERKDPASANGNGSQYDPIGDIRAARERSRSATGVRPAAPPPRRVDPIPENPPIPAGLVSLNAPQPLSNVERDILTVLAQHSGTPLSRGNTMAHAARTLNGDACKAFARLRDKGWIAKAATGGEQITGEGITALGTYKPLPQGSELREKLIAGEVGTLQPIDRELLAAIVKRYPYGGKRNEIAADAGRTLNGDACKAFARLARLGYAVKVKGVGVTAAPKLFDEEYE